MRKTLTYCLGIVWFIWLASLVLVLYTIFVNVNAASAHEVVNIADQPTGWNYPWACCSNMDCKMVDDTAVQERFEGYIITSTGEIVAYADKRVKNSPDGEYHWCAHQAGLDAGHTICLFVPPKGF